MKNFILTILCLIGFAGFSQIPTNGLVAYFPFSGDAKDASSNKTNGTTHNVTMTSDRFGTPNSAYLFNGSTSYIDFAGTYLKNNTYTYSVWAKLNSLPASGDMAFMLNIGSAGGDQSLNVANNFSGTYNGWLGGGYNTSSPNFALNENKNPSTSAWAHIVCVRYASYALLYVNNVLVDSVGAGSTMTPSYGSGTVGGLIGMRNGGMGLFNGKIDDVCIYDRALSKAEVELLYLDMPTSITDIYSNRSGFVAYPNPNHSGIFHLDLNINSSNSASVRIEISNILGQPVYQHSFTPVNGMIELQHTLSPGIHIIRMYDERNVQIGVQKVTIL